jgi:hypothetical protein
VQTDHSLNGMDFRVSFMNIYPVVKLVCFTLRRRVAFTGKLGGTADSTSFVPSISNRGRMMFFY